MKKKNLISSEVNLKEIESLLVKRKSELEEQLSKLPSDGLPSEQANMDVADQTQLVMQEVLNISLHDKEFQEYKTIINALNRIKEGDYGICIDCGTMIAPKRLVSFPNANRCVVCQEQLEEEGQA